MQSTYLNEQLHTNYQSSVLSVEYYNQYHLCKAYYELQDAHFDIQSNNDLQWNLIVKTIPRAMAVREAVRNYALCVEDWLRVFGPCPNLPLPNFCRDRVGDMELLLWKPISKRSTKRRSSGNSSNSSHNSQTATMPEMPSDSTDQTAECQSTAV